MEIVRGARRSGSRALSWLRLCVGDRGFEWVVVALICTKEKPRLPRAGAFFALSIAPGRPQPRGLRDGELSDSSTIHPHRGFGQSSRFLTAAPACSPCIVASRSRSTAASS